MGHVQADCPTVRLTGAGPNGVCYNCGQPGHLAVRAFRRGMQIVSGAWRLIRHLEELPRWRYAAWCWTWSWGWTPPGWLRPIRPWLRRWASGGYLLQMRGAESLRSRLSSSNDEVLRLWQTGRVSLLFTLIVAKHDQGHISRDCTAPNGGPLSTAGKKCYRCGDPGHISRDCPQAEQNADASATVPSDSVTTDATVSSPATQLSPATTATAA